MKTWPILAICTVAGIIFAAYAAYLLLTNWPADGWSMESAAQFGDSFGVLNSFFTGAAFLLILWTIILQKEELRLQRLEMSRMVAAHQQENQMNLLQQTLHDPDLDMVWGRDPKNRVRSKQNTYAFMLMSYWARLHSSGHINKRELEAVIHDLMRRSDIITEYWNRSLPLWKMTGTEDPLHREFIEVCEAAYHSLMVKGKEAPVAE